ncbi:MAG: hypothetical protein NTX25_11495 [Proteobacteria bacterium]|nr:hypothetical protein [Pseudomonadota bacterium]
MALSFNLVFHLASGLACVLLIYGLIRMQAQIQFHSQLWKSLDPAQKSILVDWPGVFLVKLGRVLNFPVEGLPSQGKPQRIEMKSWLMAHFELGIQRITWLEDHTLSLKVRVNHPGDHWATILQKALGGEVKVRFEVPKL